MKILVGILLGVPMMILAFITAMWLFVGITYPEDRKKEWFLILIVLTGFTMIYAFGLVGWLELK